MNYKPFDGEDRTKIFLYVLDLNMSEARKGKLLRRMYEEYRITHEMYQDVQEYIAGTSERDVKFLMKGVASPE